MLLAIDADCLTAVVEAVDPGDMLPLALTCVTLRDACVVRAEANRVDGAPRWFTGGPAVRPGRWSVSTPAVPNADENDNFLIDTLDTSPPEPLGVRKIQTPYGTRLSNIYSFTKFYTL